VREARLGLRPIKAVRLMQLSWQLEGLDGAEIVAHPCVLGYQRPVLEVVVAAAGYHQSG
jgi:hypothetical protein